jgi:hypothetical protein
MRILKHEPLLIIIGFATLAIVIDQNQCLKMEWLHVFFR